MAMKTVVGLLAVTAVLMLVMILFVWDTSVEEVPDENGTELTAEQQEIERVLAELPKEVTIEQRTVRFDQETLEPSSRDEYATTDAPLAVQADEDPLSYIERYVRGEMAEPHIRQQSDFYVYTASFHRSREGAGLTVYLRVMDIPDDSIGGTEERFDFTITNGDWHLNWYGERVFCRRPAQEFWQPADQLCP